MLDQEDIKNIRTVVEDVVQRSETRMMVGMGELLEQNITPQLEDMSKDIKEVKISLFEVQKELQDVRISLDALEKKWKEEGDVNTVDVIRLQDRVTVLESQMRALQTAKA